MKTGQLGFTKTNGECNEYAVKTVAIESARVKDTRGCKNISVYLI